MPQVPSRWLEIHVTVESELQATLAAEILVGRGARAVRSEAVPNEDGLSPSGRDRLITHLPPPEDPESFLDDLRTELATSSSPDVEITWRWQEQEDWEEVWRRGLAPKRVGKRLVVRPSWTPYDAAADDVVVVLDPGLAFGTAEHATTRGSLRLLEQQVRAGERLADVGTGSAILAVAAALLGAAHVDGFEMDPYACEAAEENVEHNGVLDRVTIHVGEVSGKPFTQSYDGLLANIEWVRMAPFVGDLVDWVRPGGWILLAGILDHQAPGVREEMSRRGLQLLSDDVEETWWAGVFRKPANAEV